MRAAAGFPSHLPPRRDNDGRCRRNAASDRPDLGAYDDPQPQSGPVRVGHGVSFLMMTMMMRVGQISRRDKVVTKRTYVYDVAI